MKKALISVLVVVFSLLIAASAYPSESLSIPGTNSYQAISGGSPRGLDPNFFSNAQSLSSSSKGWTYTDRKTGLLFTVPKGWEEASMNSKHQYLDAKFVSKADPTKIVLYGSSDLWKTLSASEKKGLKRSDIDNRVLTEDLLLTLTGASGSLQEKAFSGKTYYIYSAKASGSVSGRVVTVSMTYAFCVDNGFLYMFQFSGSESDPYYADFTSILSSVKYPSQTSSQDSSVTIIVVSLIALLLITGVVAFVVFKKKHKVQTSRQTPPQFTAPAANTGNSNSSVERSNQTERAPPLSTACWPNCPNCGKPIPSDSKFCPLCGQKTSF